MIEAGAGLRERRGVGLVDIQWRDLRYVAFWEGRGIRWRTCVEAAARICRYKI